MAVLVIVIVLVPLTSTDRVRFQVQNQPECRIAVEVVSMQPLTPQEAQALVELYRSSICRFRFECDLMNPPACQPGPSRSEPE